MVATARVIKEKYPEASVVFIGPCASKKLEASRTTVRSDVDFVITFEELTGMFEAKGILVEEIKAMDELNGATAAGRGYGVAGGVASAIESCIKNIIPVPQFMWSMRKAWQSVKDAVTCQGRQDERLPDRRYGVSRRLCSRCGYERSHPAGKQRACKIQGRSRTENSASVG